MTIRVTITNDEAPGSPAELAVTLVTVGNLEAAEQKYAVAAQGSVQLHVHRGQFLMVDEHDKEGD